MLLQVNISVMHEVSRIANGARAMSRASVIAFASAAIREVTRRKLRTFARRESLKPRRRSLKTG